MSFFEDPFAHGKWKDWLRTFEVGQEESKEVPEEDVKKIRTAISRMRTDEYYFQTAQHAGKFYIKRIPYEQWIELPKRRFV